MNRRAFLRVAAAAGLACEFGSSLAYGKTVKDRQGRYAALCIGMSYGGLSERFRLNNTLGDADRMAKAFRALEFDAVDVLPNPDLPALQAGLAAFKAKLTPDTTTVLFYAGHGVQKDAANFMLTADGKSLVSIQNVVEAVRNRSKYVVAILDACRNNPFDGLPASDMPQLGLVRGVDVTASERADMQVVKISAADFSGKKGLAEMAVAGAGVKFVFSTDPGRVAADGQGSSNSPFTASLAKALTEKKSFDDVLTDVTKVVSKATRGKQTPWTQGSLPEVIYLAGKPSLYDRGDSNFPTL